MAYKAATSSSNTGDKSAVVQTPLDLINASYNSGVRLENIENYEEAAKCFKDALSLGEAIYNPDSKSTIPLKTRDRLAYCLYEQGNFKEAEKYNRYNLELWESITGEEAEDTQKTRHELGRCLSQQYEEDNSQGGMLQESIELHRKNLTIASAVDASSEAACDARHEISYCLSLMSEYKKAAVLAKENIDRLCQREGEYAKSTIENRHLYALCLYYLGRYEEAKRECERNLDFLKKDKQSKIEWCQEIFNDSRNFIFECETKITKASIQSWNTQLDNHKNELEKFMKASSISKTNEGLRPKSDDHQLQHRKSSEGRLYVPTALDQPTSTKSANRRASFSGTASTSVQLGIGSDKSNFNSKDASRLSAKVSYQPKGQETRKAKNQIGNDQNEALSRKLPSTSATSVVPQLGIRSRNGKGYSQGLTATRKQNNWSSNQTRQLEQGAGASCSNLPKKSSSRSSPFTFPNRIKAVPVNENSGRFYNMSGDNRNFDADNWFKQLQRKTETLLQTQAHYNYKRVKIAILDTGLDLSTRDKTPEEVWRNRVRTAQPQEQSCRAQAPIQGEDINGHGTHCAYVLLKVAPRADIYIARIATTTDDVQPEPVIKAILHAVSTWQVDIISMSFGFKYNDKMATTIARTVDRFHHEEKDDVLVFAAASNAGIGHPVAFPASEPKVISIFSSTALGQPSDSNPAPTDKASFMALGEQVEAAWPVALTAREKKANTISVKSTKRRSGSSTATLIAAATAALLIEFARQRPLCDNPEYERRLRTYKGITEIFRSMDDYHKSLGYYPILPWKFLSSDRGHGKYPMNPETELKEPFSARRTIATNIVDILARAFDNAL